MTVATKLKQLYEIDDYLWLLETIELLKQNKLNELDLENLIKERLIIRLIFLKNVLIL